MEVKSEKNKHIIIGSMAVIALAIFVLAIKVIADIELFNGATLGVIFIVLSIFAIFVVGLIMLILRGLELIGKVLEG